MGRTILKTIMKPIGRKNYGSIPHLIGSKLGVGDHHITEGQHNNLTKKTRDKHDYIIVTEKYDGSNVGVAKHEGKIISLTRKGYLASSSPFEQYHYFAKWVEKHKSLFDDMLSEGERIVREWLLMAHGLRYDIKHKDPIVFFDIFNQENERIPYDVFAFRCYAWDLKVPRFISHSHEAATIEDSVCRLLSTPCKNFPCIDMSEGLVYRCERKGKVDFLAKWVRSDFEAGKYFERITGGETVWNFNPEHL